MRISHSPGLFAAWACPHMTIIAGTAAHNNFFMERSF
jgi:hypothetical protein